MSARGQATRAFEAVRNLEPYRLWDMEVYSTLLWHLQHNMRLSFLAQELLATDPKAPQTWIAVGNCFSLQKEKAQALTCFRRAAQLYPACAYAYTLSGHESIDEDLSKAINFFQCALRADARHYNAWCVRSFLCLADKAEHGLICLIGCYLQVWAGDMLHANEQVTPSGIPLSKGIKHPSAERGTARVRGDGESGAGALFEEFCEYAVSG